MHNQPTAEQRFWQWFQSKSFQLMHFESNQEAIFDELQEQLCIINEDLTFEFGPIQNGKREFVVSADGIKEAFPAVEQLVNAAPIFAEWTIIAFRQPQGTDFSIEMNGFKLSADDLWYATEPDGNKIGLTLFIRGLNADNEQALSQASFILLDTALGEYLVETKIGFIEERPLPENYASLGLRSFRSIQGEFGIAST